MNTCIEMYDQKCQNSCKIFQYEIGSFWEDNPEEKYELKPTVILEEIWLMSKI